MFDAKNDLKIKYNKNLITFTLTGVFLAYVHNGEIHFN